MNMVEALTDGLIILLNTVHDIRSSVFNEIIRSNNKAFHRKSDEALMKFQSSIIESGVSKLMTDAGRAPEVNFVIAKNDENLLNQKKESISSSSKILEEADLPGMKKNDVLKTLKVKLEDSLSFIELIKQNVTEQILIANNERSSFLSKENHEVNSDIQDISNKNSTKENVESKKKISINECDASNIVKRELLETFVETNASNRKGKNHENVMISLISDDDDSDSDCVEISLTTTNLDSTDVTNTSINPDQFVPIKLENISNFQNNYNIGATTVDISENVSEEQNDKSNKRKLDENEKHSKKKKKSRDKSASLVNLFGELYKVKLSNLSASITYAEIASLLQNSGLEFLDILLLNGGEKNIAEISFADIKMKEKALALDSPLIHAGMKIRIKSI